MISTLFNMFNAIFNMKDDAVVHAINFMMGY